ncbi:HAD family hydrolase [Chitinophaga japonensis]|uniref:HAD superfamily hydrolase (TIGR01490 family) n=1 Tax=Chitinophaga japonensis TaxID=104662 RepID=A0A562SZ01_CHIJA|nr:HAD family hydrolase [Chitinophaga japonensis]TWI86502.1 HAD superfamily hydrolase (TIGR01490 family) [Chitinophaga japonensis]
MSAIAFFDFDGTITRRDTLFEIIRFQKGAPAMYAGLLVLSPALVLFKLKVLSSHTIKQVVLRYFFRGAPQAAFTEKCEAFCRQRLPRLLRPAALGAIQQHLAKGHQVVVVTASAQDWVAPWCTAMGITCIATRLEVENGRLTGNIAGLNCNGDEKVCRIRDAYDLQAFEHVYAYGDSSGDKPMLAIAGTSQYKPFR